MGLLILVRFEEVFEFMVSDNVADSSIRQTVLASLHERFDKHLAQAENVRSLFIALNDEVFENRLKAVGLIGRLAKHNPAYVMPSLRKALIQLLTELEYSTVRYASNQDGGIFMLTLGKKAKPRRVLQYPQCPY